MLSQPAVNEFPLLLQPRLHGCFLESSALAPLLPPAPHVFQITVGPAFFGYGALHKKLH